MEKLIDSMVWILIFFAVKFKYHDYKEKQYIKNLKNDKKDIYESKKIFFLNKNDLTEEGHIHRRKGILSWLYFGITLFLWGFLKIYFYD